ncbi:MAG: sugar ABC transporter ATP-binding protein [Clostridiales Family XIII bacterium]|jgi:ribose transport system ATP-binding protein|nr:sugar ABC transporter ATP-binding protein [Clostridiales Family XIII bacterium]
MRSESSHPIFSIELYLLLDGIIIVEIALKMTRIVKSFGGVKVLDDVDFEVKKGEIHALVGENGAGKSTLMNILGGVIRSDSGKIELFSEEVSFSSPAEAQEKGIAFVHQELNVVNDLKVYETLFLGNEKKSNIIKVNKKMMIKEAKDLFDKLEIEIDPNVFVRELGATHKQIIEIAKSVLFNAKLIILDEPTTSLTSIEAENVFKIMTRLAKKHGVSIIFISHKLNEVVEFCDNYTVLRNGKKIATHSTKKEGVDEPVELEDIAKLMVGKSVLGVEVYKPRKIGPVILSVDNIEVGRTVKNISFKLHEGEILGITGLLGDGREELINSIFGEIKKTRGAFTLNGKEVKPHSPSHAKRLGIGMLPSNRKENAIIKDLNIVSNMTLVTLPQYCAGITLLKSKEYKTANEYIEKLNIKISKLQNLITSLSGGNQQKVVLAKWLIANPKVLILCNPTQGVDVGAKNEIYNIIMQLAARGLAIIITTGEAQEAMKICDRLIVMYHGTDKGILKRNEFAEESIMILSTGGVLKERNNRNEN